MGDDDLINLMVRREPSTWPTSTTVVTTTTPTGADDIIAGIRAAYERMPKLSVLASSQHFRPNVAMKFTDDDGRDYVCAHPAVWEKVPAKVTPWPNPFVGSEVVDLDAPSNEKLRIKIMLALTVKILAAK